MNAQRAARLTVHVEVEKWPLKAPFRITGHTFVDVDVVVVRLEQDGAVGRGEAAGVYYRADNAQRMVAQIEAVRTTLESGVDRESLRRVLPAGGARNAVDCALWDLEAKLARTPAWQLAGLASLDPLVTTFTLGADSPDKTAEGARAFVGARAIKLKLTGTPVDADRVRAARAARPDVWLGIDANQGFTRAFLEEIMPVLLDARVALIEQPFPVGLESEIDGLRSPIPVAADESVQDSRDIASLVGRFNVVNIKLDKCGGLTEAFTMAEEARRHGLDIMVGNMTGTALAMAPGMLIGQLCKVVDLDGAIFLREDRSPGTVYRDGTVWCPDSVWGGGGSHA
jgi:L-alanine-DL-glutamate epimerase-like enolase superfamily enzyme